MVSIPDSPTKRQDDIVLPSTLEEAIEMLLAKDVLLEQKDKELVVVRQERDSAYEDLDTEREETTSQHASRR